jgi:hypothetical protein
VMKSTELTNQSRCISAPSSMRSRDDGSLVLCSSTQHEYFQSPLLVGLCVTIGTKKKFWGQLWGHRRLAVKTTYRNNRWLRLLCSCFNRIRIRNSQGKSLRLNCSGTGVAAIRTADPLITKNSQAVVNLTQPEEPQKNSADKSAVADLLWFMWRKLVRRRLIALAALPSVFGRRPPGRRHLKLPPLKSLDVN